ncbi:lytic transglycosylase domain-containing protein [Mesorhizobium sp. NPDC059054]|uniref:lytic transglycosylase domain-containing protein n=1 Tax=Mesorhizobium sp. NPDC059054 TaxID=3346711 RepID=UPI0036745C56
MSLSACLSLCLGATGTPRKCSRPPVLWLHVLVLVATAAGTRAAEPTPQQRPWSVDLHASHIAEAGRRFDIPLPWIRAVLQIESAGNVRAVSSAGAMGLMQIMPETWTSLRIRYWLAQDPFAPRDNILAGTAYLREMYDRYGRIDAMLAAYNAGPGRYDEFITRGRPLPAATIAYVAAVLSLLEREFGPSAARRQSASPSGWRGAALFARSKEERDGGLPRGAADSLFPRSNRQVGTP